MFKIKKNNQFRQENEELYILKLRHIYGNNDNSLENVESFSAK